MQEEIIPEIESFPENERWKLITSFRIACKSLEIKTFGDAYAILKLKRKLFSETPIELCDDEMLVIMIVIKAINGDWIPNYEDENQKKHFPVFVYRAGSGFVFSDTYCSYSLTYTASGSRLCLESEEKAEFVGQNFPEYNNAILL